MSSSQDDSKRRALAREWAAARIVLLGGFAIAIAVAGYFLYRAHQENVAAQQAEAARNAPPAKIDPKALARLQAYVCSTIVKRGQDIGIVPPSGVLASPNLIKLPTPRRYVCIAATHLTKYIIAADLLCDDIKKLAQPSCVSVFRIALPDGRLVYARAH